MKLIFNKTWKHQYPWPQGREPVEWVAPWMENLTRRLWRGLPTKPQRLAQGCRQAYGDPCLCCLWKPVWTLRTLLSPPPRPLLLPHLQSKAGSPMAGRRQTLQTPGQKPPIYVTHGAQWEVSMSDPGSDVRFSRWPAENETRHRALLNALCNSTGVHPYPGPEASLPAQETKQRAGWEWGVAPKMKSH